MIVEPDRAAAIGLAVSAAAKGDVILVAGKGHERGQYVAGRVLPFDDREVTADALRHRAAAYRAAHPKSCGTSRRSRRRGRLRYWPS